ncbi:hypothetical protein MBANPS3_011042 [Mucor bainieri]
MNTPKTTAESIPTEILLQIFEHVGHFPHYDMIQLQRVCHGWHLAAKQVMYRNPSIRTDTQIEQFAKSNQHRDVATIPAPGPFVRELNLGRMNIQVNFNYWIHEDFPPKAIALLLKQCTHLASLEYEGSQEVICEAISYLPSSALAHLKKLPKDHDINDPCVKKCQTSLTEVHMTAQTSCSSIQDLEKFPRLLSLYYTGDILDAYPILKSCNNLRHLSITQTGYSTTNQHQVAAPHIEKHSSLLEGLGLLGTTRLRSLALLLPALSSLAALWIEDLESSFTSAEFASFYDRASRIENCEFTISSDTDDIFSKLPAILSAISNSTTSSSQGTRCANTVNLEIDGTDGDIPRLVYSRCGRRGLIEMRLLKNFIGDEQLQQDCIDGFGSIADTVMLHYFEEGSSKRRTSNKRRLSTLLHSILQKCPRLHSVELLGGQYTSISNDDTINNSLRQLKIDNCHWEPGFLCDVSKTCPNLISISIRSAFHKSADINVSMPHSSMDLVTLRFPYFSFTKITLMRIKLGAMLDGISYYLVKQDSKKATKIPRQDVKALVKKANLCLIDLEFRACKKVEYYCRNDPAVAIFPAKQITYQNPFFSTDTQIKKFATSNQHRDVATIPAPGLFVRELDLATKNIQVDFHYWIREDFSPKMMAMLLKQCPNLESLEYAGSRKVICEAISHLPSSAGDIMDAYPILKSCNNLRHLSITQTGYSIINQHQVAAPHIENRFSFLEGLKLSGTTYLCSLALLLPALSSLAALWIENLANSFTSAEFASFCDRASRIENCEFAISSKLPAILLAISSSISSNRNQGTRCENTITFNIRGANDNTIPKLFYSKTGRRRLIRMELPKDFIRDAQLQQDCIDGFGSFADIVSLYFEEDEEEESTETGKSNRKRLSNFLHSILRKCSSLKTVVLDNGYYINVAGGGISTSLNEMKMTDCRWEPTFLRDVSNACPNLTKLHIDNLRFKDDSINATMPYTSMDLVTIQFPYFPYGKTVLISIKLASMTADTPVSYFLVQKDCKNASKIPCEQVQSMLNTKNVYLIALEFEACKKVLFDYKTGPTITISPESITE